MGDIFLVVCHDLHDWNTVDLSVGAIDAIASLETLTEGAKLRLAEYSSTETLLEVEGLIGVSAIFPTNAPGLATSASLFVAGDFAEEIVDRSTDDLKVRLTTITPNANGNHGLVTGIVFGTICAFKKPRKTAAI